MDYSAIHRVLETASAKQPPSEAISYVTRAGLIAGVPVIDLGRLIPQDSPLGFVESDPATVGKLNEVISTLGTFNPDDMAILSEELGDNMSLVFATAAEAARSLTALALVSSSAGPEGLVLATNAGEGSLSRIWMPGPTAETAPHPGTVVADLAESYLAAFR